MHRRKPASAKQRKAQLKLKRAVKRGDADPPSQKQPHTRKKQQRGSRNAGVRVVAPSRRLQSSFIQLPPRFLEETRLLANKLTFSRPIAPEVAVFDDHGMSLGYLGSPKPERFTIPKRPRWRYDMTKEALEKNEEGLFRKWLDQTDDLISAWLNGVEDKPALKMPRSPTYFERNIEVWRQLWRVTEISEIILVLVDSRCPLLHYPPCLSEYLADHKVILVLTKVDVSGPVRAEAWTAYFHAHYPNLRVVEVESYVEKQPSATHQGRTLFRPHLPDAFRGRLVNAIKEVHAEMLEPPERIRSDRERMKKWKPPVKQDIDWNALSRPEVDSEGHLPVLSQEEENKLSVVSTADAADAGPNFLTIGLIGQPNVGKSSLLNALFGASKVRASRTPGKTKHFQTLFWSPDVRLVDCPGLVMPNFVPMEMQVLSGVLPISKVSAIPSCIYHAAQYLPVEQIFSLSHPALNSAPAEDKRTWRAGARPSSAPRDAMQWTTTDILTAFAESKGWVTAKAGRPDVHRAGNAVLRALAEGRIGWSFWPPGTEVSTVKMHSQLGAGIWTPHITMNDEEPEGESEDDEDDEEVELLTESEEITNAEGSGECDLPSVSMSTGGRFGVLSLDGVNSSDDGL